jgi:hypothetical protein
MKTRTTVLLLLAGVALAAYIKFIESKGPNTLEAIQRRQNVVNFDRENLDGIVIQNGDDKIEFKRQDKKWRIETPFKDQADSTAMESLLSALEGWQKWDTIPAKEVEKDKGRLDEFGLTKTKLHLKLIGKDMPAEVIFGGDSAFEGRMYVRLEGSNDVFITSNTVRSDVSKKAEDFRDRRLTDLTSAQVTRALLKTSAGEMEMEKKGDHWEIVKPLRARGDDQKIVDLFSQVTTARIQQFVADDHGDLHPYGLAEPRGSITLFAADDKAPGSKDASHGDQGHTLQIGGPSEKDKGQVYVRFTARNAVYTLPKKIEDLLATKPSDLRDRHLIQFDANILDRFTIDAAGKGKTVLARKEENWTIANRNNAPANSKEVNRLIDLLKAEQITKFVEDVASDLPKYGLDKPVLQLTFSSYASENTAETTAGENPITTVIFGKTDGDDVYARLGEEPFIVAVHRTLLESIPTDSVQWQDLAIFHIKADEVSKLTITPDYESTLTREAGKEWTWVKGNEPINQTKVQSILNSLTGLRAVRWAGTTTPAHGLDKPQLTITFATASDEKKLHKLVVGNAADGGMWYAHTDDHEGTFVISGPDFDVLRSSLVAAPASATPGPTTVPNP